MRQTKQQRAADRRIEKVYYQRMPAGFQISILDIPRVFAVGHRAIAQQTDISDAQLGDEIFEFATSLGKVSA